MGEELFIEIMREGIWVMIKVSAPALLVALCVGLVVSLIQALTQIQEMTLTFVPKVLAMLAVLILSLPFMLATLTDFTEGLYARIAGMGAI